MKIGLVIVDHGSRRSESNRLLETVAERFADRFAHRHPIVEPAHMELAEPTIATAYARCAARGADTIVVVPFFLGPGKHWNQDIPRLAAEAAEQWPNTQFRVAAVLGCDDLLVQLLEQRARECIDSDPELIAARAAASAAPAR